MRLNLRSPFLGGLRRRGGRSGICFFDFINLYLFLNIFTFNKWPMNTHQIHQNLSSIALHLGVYVLIGCLQMLFRQIYRWSRFVLQIGRLRPIQWNATPCLDKRYFIAFMFDNLFSFYEIRAMTLEKIYFCIVNYIFFSFVEL